MSALDRLIAAPRLCELDHVDLAAPPDAPAAAIGPWLLQMGCGRAGFYSIDLLDNGGRRSAREVHPELAALAVGDVIAATPDGHDGFEVLRLERDRALVLGGLYDVDGKRQLPFAARRPARYWQVTWAFVLEPLDGGRTRLHARARGAFSPSERPQAAWIRPVHWLMQTAQLRRLAARAEGRLHNDDWHDLLDAAGGAALIVFALFTPFFRGARAHWGLSPTDAARRRRLRPAQRRHRPPRVAGARRRSALPAPAHAAHDHRRGAARPPLRRARRGRLRARRRQAVGRGELAVPRRAARPRPLPLRQPLPRRLVG